MLKRISDDALKKLASLTDAGRSPLVRQGRIQLVKQQNQLMGIYR
jgi:hypothetical protein